MRNTQLVRSIVWVVLMLASGVPCPWSDAAGVGDSVTARIWGAGKHYEGFWDAFANSFKNRTAWRQVPCGNADHQFKGDVVLENEFFYISFNANSQDELHVKRGESTARCAWRSPLKRRHGLSSVFDNVRHMFACTDNAFETPCI